MVMILLYIFPNGEVNPLDYNSKIHTTDRQTDGQTDRCKQRQYPFGLKGQGVKNPTPTHTDGQSET